MVDTTTSFDLQSPEFIAKEYGGNKQKIAQAMQTGIIDPTSGLLAGMFIDRMRSAQAAEAGPQQTVAQQVFAPPQAPQGMPPQGGAPQGGLGGMPPPGMGGPPPQGAMTSPPMQGLTDMPIPDQMFDEGAPSMAGGGLVAFAGGGDVDYDSFYNAIVGQESGGRYGVANTEGSGALGLGQIMPDTARALAKKLGLPYDPSKLAGTDEASQEYQNALTDAAVKEAWEYGKGDPAEAAKYYFAGPNKKGWKGKTAKYAQDILGRLGRPAEAAAGATQPITTEEAVTGLDTLSPGVASDYIAQRKAMVPRDTSRRTELMALLDEQRSPEAMKAQKEQDMWSMLAQVGFGTAAGKSGNFLTDLGQAANSALPAAQEAAAARKAQDMELLRQQVELEQVGNADLERDADAGTDLYKASIENVLRKDLAMLEDKLRREGMKQDKIQAHLDRVEGTKRAWIAYNASKPQVQRAAETHYRAMKLRQQQKRTDYNGLGLFKANGKAIADTELRALALQYAMDQETNADVAARSASALVKANEADPSISGMFGSQGGGGVDPASFYTE